MNSILTVVNTALLAILGIHSISSRKALSKQIARVSNRLVLQWFHHRSLTSNPDAVPGKPADTSNGGTGV